MGTPSSRHKIPTGGRMQYLLGGRHRVVQVRVSDAEFEALEAKAVASGVSIPRYVIGAVLDETLTVAERRYWLMEINSLLRTLVGARNRLDALIELGRAAGSIPPEVTTAAKALTRMESRVTEAAANFTRAFEETDRRARREGPAEAELI